MRSSPALVLAALLPLSACSTEEESPIEEQEVLAPALGTGDHSPSSVTFTVVASAAEGLDEPRDLAFNPLRPGELWIVNFADDSVVIVAEAPEESRTHEKRIDGYALHFMEEVTAIDFGGDETTFGIPGTFATCGESRNTYNGQAPGNDFTGPTLWSSDLSIFAAQDPNGLGSHLDMLHNTPLCMGIVHEAENRYWTVNGLAGSIDRYDFQEDDGIGNDEHGDGLTWRYAAGELTYVPGIPSHLALDGDAGMLYIADPGASRIARMDIAAGSEAGMVRGLETPIQMMEGAVLENFQSDPELMTMPTGLALADGILYVSDRETSRLLAFDLEGVLINHLDTGLPPGSLSGIAMGPEGKLYVVDTAGDRVLRVDPAPQDSGAPL